MNAAQELQKLEQEVKAIRAAFQQNAATMKVYTSTLQFTTSENFTSWTNSGSYETQDWPALISMEIQSDGKRFDDETIVVTFDCDAGINTFASLEIDPINVKSGMAVLTVERVPYSGGAQWLITLQPRSTQSGGYDVWQPSTLNFAVQSAAPGTLGAKMIWQ